MLLFGIKMPVVVVVTALSSMAACSQVFADNQREVVIAPDGTEIAKIVQADRRMPRSTIGVCSDGWFDDVKNLKVVARIVVPEETYTIIDARSLPEDFEERAVTLVYFGAPLSKIGSNECLDRFPRLKEFVAEQAREIQLKNDEHDLVLRKQFGTDTRVLGDVNCAGAEYPKYSLQLKNEMEFMYRDLKYHSSGAMCEMGYLAVFDIYEIYSGEFKDDFAIKFILENYSD